MTTNDSATMSRRLMWTSSPTGGEAWNQAISRPITVDAWTASNGIRNIVLVVLERPMPSPGSLGAAWRRTARGKAYGAWRARTRERLAVALVGVEGWPCPADWHVGAAWAFGATPASPPGAARRKDGEVDRRTVKSVLDWDLRNLQKASEDVLTGLLWADDRQVRFEGPGAAIDTGCDWWAAHAWTGPPGTDLSWREAWAERSVTETLRVVQRRGDE